MQDHIKMYESITAMAELIKGISPETCCMFTLACRVSEKERACEFVYKLASGKIGYSDGFNELSGLDKIKYEEFVQKAESITRELQRIYKGMGLSWNTISFTVQENIPAPICYDMEYTMHGEELPIEHILGWAMEQSVWLDEPQEPKHEAYVQFSDEDYIAPQDKYAIIGKLYNKYPCFQEAGIIAGESIYRALKITKNADENAIEGLKRLELKLSRAYLNIFNYFDGEYGFPSGLGMAFGCSFIGAGNVLGLIKEYKSEELPFLIKSNNGCSVQLGEWKKGRIPFARNDKGDLFLIDFIPAEGGKQGQIITYDAVKKDSWVFADSIEHFFEIMHYCLVNELLIFSAEQHINYEYGWFSWKDGCVFNYKKEFYELVYNNDKVSREPENYITNDSFGEEYEHEILADLLEF